MTLRGAPNLTADEGRSRARSQRSNPTEKRRSHATFRRPLWSAPEAHVSIKISQWSDSYWSQVRRMTPAQLKAAIQKAQRDNKRAVDDYNRKARQYNAAVEKLAENSNEPSITTTAKCATITRRPSPTIRKWKFSVAALTKSFNVSAHGPLARPSLQSNRQQLASRRVTKPLNCHLRASNPRALSSGS